ncbi:YhbY family RNA-binding protein [Ruminococcaceae bacterium OttesenSCG-928-A11]|nr:YhbY family RNA-binding protein [Ruminococcaceae bacterium OttesenSCG-928-A11]
MLTSKTRAALRKEANGLQALFQVGKGGVDAQLTQGVAECLAKRELVKLRLLETSPVDARTAAEELAGATGAEVVQVIGRVVVLFLKKKKESAFDWVKP